MSKWLRRIIHRLRWRFDSRYQLRLIVRETWKVLAKQPLPKMGSYLNKAELEALQKGPFLSEAEADDE